MEDKEKRNSSEPSASSVSSEDGSSKPAGRRGSEPEMFDQHEQTLPRFTIDPGDAAPRQRTRTLLGVPSMVSESEPAPLRPPTPPAMPADDAADVAPTTKLSSAILESPTATETVREGIIDITVEVDEDMHDINEVTMVSDADVVALPDNTGQLQPVRLDELAAAAGTMKEKEKDEPKTSAEPPYAATAPHPNSLSPREISRPAAPQQPRDNSNRFGALLVAAVMLLATGAWFLTAGTFRRATLSTPAESTTAAATQPTPSVEKKVEPPAVPAAPAEKPAEALSSAPSTTAPTLPSKTDESAAPALKSQKPALTASARGERVRRSGRSKTNATPAPTGDLPMGPSRAEVISRLESVRPAVQACAAGRSGIADLDITIAHTGVVMHVLVGGDFAGTTEGSCIARAVRQARFPQFQQERFRLLYPYAI